MELINIQNNIVVIYNEGIDLSSLKTDPIELAIQDIFMEKNPKPIISKFPNQLAIIIPEAQTTITVSDRYLILTDQSIGDFTKKDSKRFFLLVGKVLSLIDKKSFKYGYNFIYDFSGLETSEILKLIGKKFFIDDAKSMVPKDDELEIALPVISFKHKKAQYNLGFGKFMPDILKEDEYKIRVQLNINFKDSLPDLNGLNDNYIEEESYGREYIMSTIK